jgi:hypothetical protein
MHTQTVNINPARTAVKMADIIGIEIGCTPEYLESINNPILHKELITSDRYDCITLIKPFQSTIDLLSIPEGYIVISNKPFVIYCLRDKGLSKLALEVSQSDKLNDHKSILLDKGSWFFFLHRHHKIPGYNYEYDYNPNPNGSRLKLPLEQIRIVVDNSIIKQQNSENNLN